MPRPQLGIGEYGTIGYSRDGTKHVAMARYRDTDGETRRVKAVGSSKSAAAAALREKFKERAHRAGDDDITSESTISELADKYLAEKQTENLAPNTILNNRRSMDNHIKPKLGKLRLREATPQRISKFVTGVTLSNGPGTALMVRSILSGMFAAAARWDAVPSNPVAYTKPPKLEQKPIRALSLEELVRMRELASEVFAPFTLEQRLERANGDVRRLGGQNRSRTTLDIIDFLVGTGCRAAEPPGLAREDVHLDDPAPWVKIHKQIVMVPGEGLLRTPTKERDVRDLRLPGFVVEMLRRRRLEHPDAAMVFPSERGNGYRSPRNIATAFQKAFAGTEFEWMTPKTLRKTVATLIDGQSGSAQAAQQLGHKSDTMTRRHYIEPSRLPIDSGSVLELFQQESA
jgi:integrase